MCAEGSRLYDSGEATVYNTCKVRGCAVEGQVLVAATSLATSRSSLRHRSCPAASQVTSREDSYLLLTPFYSTNCDYPNIMGSVNIKRPLSL